MCRPVQHSRTKLGKPNPVCCHSLFGLRLSFNNQSCYYGNQSPGGNESLHYENIIFCLSSGEKRLMTKEKVIDLLAPHNKGDTGEKWSDRKMSNSSTCPLTALMICSIVFFQTSNNQRCHWVSRCKAGAWHPPATPEHQQNHCHIWDNNMEDGRVGVGGWMVSCRPERWKCIWAVGLIPKLHRDCCCAVPGRLFPSVCVSTWDCQNSGVSSSSFFEAH